MKTFHEELSKDASNKISRCIMAWEKFEIIPEWEFQTIVGICKEEFFRKILEWPDISLEDEDAKFALRAAVRNLWGYPHGYWPEIERQLSLRMDTVKELGILLK